MKEKKSFKCYIRDYRSCKKSNLNQHVTSVHEGQNPRKCEILVKKKDARDELMDDKKISREAILIPIMTQINTFLLDFVKKISCVQLNDYETDPYFL